MTKQIEYRLKPQMANEFQQLKNILRLFRAIEDPYRQIRWMKIRTWTDPGEESGVNTQRYRSYLSRYVY